MRLVCERIPFRSFAPVGHFVARDNNAKAPPCVRGVGISVEPERDGIASNNCNKCTHPSGVRAVRCAHGKALTNWVLRPL